MGTRGCIGFIRNGKEELCYNHWDSYPSELGVRMLGYCRSHTPAEMAAIADKLVMVAEDATPTEQETVDHLDSLNTEVSTGSPTEYYSLLREAQGDLAYYDDPRHYVMVDYAGFLVNSLFCEWAYLINLDTGLLECYKGFNKDPDAPGRYAALASDSDGYYGVVLVASYPLDALPSDEEFVATLDPRDE